MLSGRRTLTRGLALAAGGVLLALVLLHVYFAAMIAWWATHPPVATAFMAERMRLLHEHDPRARTTLSPGSPGPSRLGRTQELVVLQDATHDM